MMKKMDWSFAKRVGWEWPLCGLVVMLLALYVTGHALFGLRGPLTALFVGGGTLVTTLLVAPLLALATGLAASFATAVGAVLGTLVLPVVAFANGLVLALWGWLLTTWVGTLLITPVYGVLAPVVLKVLPFVSMGNYVRKAYDWLDDQPWWPERLVLTENHRATRAPAPKTKGKKRA